MVTIDLSGKVAFVTGASKGIGRAIAETLAQCGANVGLMARGPDELRQVEAAINSKTGGRALAVAGDVSNPTALEACLHEVVRAFGALHLAVNNAGITGEFGLLHESTADNWRRVQAVNLDGIFFAMKFEIAEMLKSGGGSIVNIGSVEGHTVLQKNPAYTSSKHAVVGLTQAAARDYASKRVRVNSVSPGVIRTPLVEGLAELLARFERVIPIGRVGEPVDVAFTVAFLLSDLSSYTTGSDFVVDGGFLLRGE